MLAAGERKSLAQAPFLARFHPKSQLIGLGPGMADDRARDGDHLGESPSRAAGDVCTRHDSQWPSSEPIPPYFKEIAGFATYDHGSLGRKPLNQGGRDVCLSRPFAHGVR